MNMYVMHNGRGTSGGFAVEMIAEHFNIGGSERVVYMASMVDADWMNTILLLMLAGF